MDSWHFLNGKWVRTPDLKISAFDLLILRGFGAFDFLRTYHNKPFGLNDHLNRFFRSAKLLGLKVPKTKEEIKKIVFAGIKKNNFPETNIKIILTGGLTQDGITPIGKPLLLMMFTKINQYPKQCYQKGAKVITIRSTRSLPEAKTLDYKTAVLAMMRAKKEGAQEALYVDEKGEIFEATRCNFFAVTGEGLVTPKKGILLGITRKAVIKLAEKLKIKVLERELNIREIKNFQGAFLTASNREIMPVVQIDKQRIGDGRVGGITRKLMEEFQKLTRG